MIRLSEYYVEYHHVKGTENGLADGLSRMRTDMMEPPKLRGDWEDVAVIEEEELYKEGKVSGGELVIGGCHASLCCMCVGSDRALLVNQTRAA